MSDLSLLKKTRGYHRARVTNKCRYARTNLDSFSESDILQNISALRDLKSKLDSCNEKIAELVWDASKESDIEDELKSCDSYNDEIIAVIVLLESSMKSSSVKHDVISGNHIKYPPLPLPCYSHAEGESLDKFLLGFEKAMDTMKVDTYVKFIYLQKQLSGQPLALVKSLASTEQTYEEAKILLQKAFGSSILRKFETLQSLSELKLTYQGDPYEFIGKMKTIKNTFSTLNISTDDVLQYFFWVAMNDKFQSQLTAITNKNRPSLKELEDNVFEATERYVALLNRQTEKKKPSNPKGIESSSLAVNANPENVSNSSFVNSKNCILCKSDASNACHPIFKCKVYVSPEAKLQKLESIGACSNCGNSHKTKECRYRFLRRCSKCSKWHFNFLCNAQNPASSTKKVFPKAKEVPKPVISSEFACTEVESLHLEYSCEACILPTFSTLTNNNVLMRCLKDTGSQLNFVDSEFARQNQFEIVKSNFSITVKGINSTRKLVTEIVRVPMHNGEKEHILEAVCIPQVKTRLVIPGLHRVVKDFMNKGHILADKFLINSEDEISDIKFILGTDSAHFLPETTVLFGSPIPSAYCTTSLGTMLCGNITRLNSNLKFLSNVILADVAEVSSNAEMLNLDSPEILAYSDSDTNLNFSVVDDHGKIVQSKLQMATDEILHEHCSRLLNYEHEYVNDSNVESNDKLVKYVLDSAYRTEDGRLVLPLLWNHKVSHLLGKNQTLSKLILKSNFKKYSKDCKTLDMIDNVFKEQESLGIIERVEDLPKFLEEHPNYSFLPHMPVFRADKESTKCRVVFLSNLSESDPTKPMTVSHNQAMMPGPCLNKKLSTSLMQLRFDEYLLVFDLKKAFLQIQLPDSDQVKLLFYWYRNVAKKDFNLVVFKHVRLPFGLRPSPTLLLLGLFKLLVIDATEDSKELADLKKLIYDLVYMDNCAISFPDKVKLEWAYEQLNGIFGPYKFDLQQFVTNHTTLQEKIDKDQGIETPIKVKLFGLIWDRGSDTLAAQKFNLNKKATTKREILRSIASNFDVFNFAGPLMNRARLFMHELQCLKSLGWDSKLQVDKLREWGNICNQVNSSPELPVGRFIGDRSDELKLIAFTDSSKSIYGCVLYIYNVKTQKVNFLLSKNRIVNKQLECKSMPSLEFQAICLGTEVLSETYDELSGPSCVNPINIVGLELYTDSLVCLNWLNSYVNSFDKLRNLSVFIKNRLEHICRICEKFPVKFSFCEGIRNPADVVTRPISHKMLIKTNYFNVQQLISSKSLQSAVLEVEIPNPLVKQGKSEYDTHCHATDSSSLELKPCDHIIPLNSYSTFHKLCTVHIYVLKFVNNLKLRLKEKDATKYSHFKCFDVLEANSIAKNFLILRDQYIQFPEVFAYFNSSNKVKDMPNIVAQLNIFPDPNGLLRVKSKTARWKDKDTYSFAPILLSKSSLLTEMIISDLHSQTCHSGVYSVLSELRKRFWVPHCFSIVKRVLKKCVRCRRFNNRTLKLNQSPYRDFRLEPPNIPYRYIFLDYLGPYYIRYNGVKRKVWLLCITCLWSRAINLKLCFDLTVQTFLRAFQLHIFEYGMPQICLSDKGSQIVPGTNIISDFISDPEAKQYLQENGIQCVEFYQYFKGCPKLGSLVESCVKLVKRLIHGSIGNSVLEYLDFEFIIFQTIHLVNRRPIAFKDSLRDCNLNEEIPAPITPEILLKGYELISLNIIPDLTPINLDPTWSPELNPVGHIKDSYAKLRKARSKLIDIYNSEFLSQLISQATDSKSRYKPVSHKGLQVGDIVLLKEALLKPASYPMGIVKKLQVNSINEVTGATILKGNKEIVERHASSIIPLLTVNEYSPNHTGIPDSPLVFQNSKTKNDKGHMKRKAAIESEQRTRSIYVDDSA